MPPLANAGPDQNLADTDQLTGETVVLNGAGSQDPDGTIAAYQWFNTSGALIASGETPTVRLSDGRQDITLRVTDSSGATASDTVSILIAAPAVNRAPIATAGVDRIIADSNGVAGETVTLDGSLSSDPDGTIVTYEWLLGTRTVIANGDTPTVQLTDGPQCSTCASRTTMATRQPTA